VKEVLMRLIACAAAAAAAALLLAAPGTAGKGGPTPDPLFGWEGITSQNGALRYVALLGPKSTTVATIRVRDGRVAGWGTFTGSVGIPLVSFDGTPDGLSADGMRLVLASYTARTYALKTSFVVVDTKTMKALRRIELPGHWAFDALSPNGKTIYALQYGAPGSGHYAVRAIDADSGRVVPGAIIDQREPDEEMLGSPMTRTWSANRSWAYTLYAKPDGTAFVHGLDTSNRRAVCLDLPWKRLGDSISRVRLQVSEDGGTLLLRQPGLGRLASIDLRSYRVTSFDGPT
jgi:hypothetical protein